MDVKRLRTNLMFSLPLLLVTPLLMIAIGIPPIFAVMMFALSLLVTVPMIGGMYLLHRRSFANKGKAEGNTSVEQARSVEIDLPLDQAYDLCEDAIASLTGTEFYMMVFKHKLRAKIQPNASSRAQGRLVATTRSRWGLLSNVYDEMRITLKLTTIDANTTRVHIHSEPTLATALMDFGYSLHNVNSLAHYLRRENARLTHADRLAERPQEMTQSIARHDEEKHAQDQAT